MSGGAITLALGPEPVEVPLRGQVEVRGNVPFWIGQALHAADFAHRVTMRAGEGSVRAARGREGVLQVRCRKVRQEA